MIIQRVSSGRAYWLTLSLPALLILAQFANTFAKSPEIKPGALATSNGKLLDIDRRTAGR